MRTQPGAQQRPKSFHGVDVDLAEAVPVLVAGMADPSCARSPRLAGARRCCIRPCGRGCLGRRRRYDRLDRGLLHIGQHMQDHLAAALDQAEDGRLVLLQRAAPSVAFPTASPLEPWATPPGAPASLRHRPSRPFWPLLPAALCARPRRKPRRSPPRPSVLLVALWRPTRRAVAPSWPARPRRPGPAHPRSAGSRGSAP